MSQEFMYRYIPIKETLENCCFSQVPDPNPDDLEGDVTTLYDRWLARASFLEDGEP